MAPVMKPHCIISPIQRLALNTVEIRWACCALQAQRSFPLELPLFASHKELQAHLTSAHSLCSFCNKHFFSAEDLWEHVHDNHFTCQLCLQHGAQRHFAAAEHLTEHLRYGSAPDDMQSSII